MDQVDGRFTERPILGLSAAEAGKILGITALGVGQLIITGVLPKAVKGQHHGLDRDDVERVSLERYKRGRRHPYWATEREAAHILGITRPGASYLRRASRLPVIEHRGRHYYRRAQLEVIANARESRRLGVNREWTPIV